MEVLKNLFAGTGTATAILYLSLTAFGGILIGKIEIKKVKLGIAGVLFSGLFFAHFGAQADPHVLHFVREFGLILFVYAIGIDVGPRFLNTFRNDGLTLNLFAAGIVVAGFAIAYMFYYWGGVSPAIITGIMSGAVTNTPGLGAAQQVLTEFGKPEDAAVTGMGYAIAYPFGVLGIILFLSCVGLSSGGQFVQTLVNGGYIWLFYGAAITFIPIFLVAVIARSMKMNYLKICGIVSGAMTDPPALEYANSLAPGHAQSSAYATVYPLTMFLRILLAQTLILITL
jgi:AspT/YidE/YbjL antiporter-like protein